MILTLLESLVEEALVSQERHKTPRQVARVSRVVRVKPGRARAPLRQPREDNRGEL